MTGPAPVASCPASPDPRGDGAGRPYRPQRELARLEEHRDGVAHALGAPRVATGVDGHRDLGLPGPGGGARHDRARDGRDPRGRALGVARGDAEDAVRLGVGRDLGVDAGVARRGVDEPRAVEVAREVVAPHPGEPGVPRRDGRRGVRRVTGCPWAVGREQLGEVLAHVRRDDGHDRARVEEAPRAACGDGAAADDDDAAAVETQAEGVRHVDGCGHGASLGVV